MTTRNGSGDEAFDVRELARRGVLAKHARTLSGPDRRRLRVNAYEILWPAVFQNWTRRIEIKRGHYGCANSLHRLEPECLDRFHDDMDAVLDDLFQNATTPIMNLEGWVTRRIIAATVDAHRRRRGERGALQRPRLPGWLIAGLDNEPRLMSLAVNMLVWVGVEASAGLSVWPIEAWADRRAMVTGDRDGAHHALAYDIDTVLKAMRQRPEWYAKYVERPLGRKQAPLVSAAADQGTEPTYLALTESHEIEDAHLVSLATVAMTMISVRLARGEDVRTVVVEVLGLVFGSGTGAEDLARCPGGGSADERMGALLADPIERERIIAAVLKLLSDKA